MPSAAQCRQWCARVHNTQCTRMSPEERQALSERVEASRQFEERMRSCNAVRCHAERSSALANEGLRQMAVCSAPAEFTAVQQRWESAQVTSSGLQAAALGQLRGQAFGAAANAQLLRPMEESRSHCLVQVSALAGVADFGAVAADAEQAGASGNATMDDLLRQLRTEPQENEECAAKFMLYETFFSQVEQTRGNLLDFYKESEQTVPPAVLAEMTKNIKGIDSAQAMGIPDDTRNWFVYHMMRQASQNNGRMANILRDFEKKLEFLATQTETDCPVCLEPFTEGGSHVAETLGCCHKVCKECWQHWSQVMHGNPFCPLCRHDAFVDMVAQQAHR